MAHFMLNKWNLKFVCLFFFKQEENATASGCRYHVPQLPSRKGMRAQRGGEAGGPPSAEASGCGLALRPVTRRCPHGTLGGPSSAPLMRTCTSLHPAKNWGFQPRGQRQGGGGFPAAVLSFTASARRTAGGAGGQGWVLRGRGSGESAIPVFL